MSVRIEIMARLTLTPSDSVPTAMLAATTLVRRGGSVSVAVS
ncbi:hypothetical protein ACQR1I_25780 [Bradyrhizobium sp. HKCCYLS2038]